jgi:hypothetical protein
MWSSAADAEANLRGQAVIKALLSNNLNTKNAPSTVVQLGQFAPVGPANTLKSRIVDSFKADSPDIISGAADIIFIEIGNRYAEELSPKYPTVAVNVEDASYRFPGRAMSMKLTITNNHNQGLMLGEAYFAAARFLDNDVSKDTTGYPQDLLAEDGLTVSDNSPLAPGETRTVEVTVSDATWEIFHLRDQIEATLSTLNRTFGVRMFFFDPNRRPQTISWANIDNLKQAL